MCNASLPARTSVSQIGSERPLTPWGRVSFASQQAFSLPRRFRFRCHSVNVHEAKTQFSKLLARVERGHEVLISRAGKPVARLVPHQTKPPRPVFGADRGRLVVPDDFDQPLPDEVLEAFEGRGR